jgi:hypothetical protein
MANSGVPTSVPVGKKAPEWKSEKVLTPQCVLNQVDGKQRRAHKGTNREGGDTVKMSTAVKMEHQGEKARLLPVVDGVVDGKQRRAHQCACSGKKIAGMQDKCRVK